MAHSPPLPPSVDTPSRRRHADVNFDELARSTEDFNGAMLKAVCVEAGMLALRQESSVIKHEHFNEVRRQGRVLVEVRFRGSLATRARSRAAHTRGLAVPDALRTRVFFLPRRASLRSR